MAILRCTVAAESSTPAQPRISSEFPTLVTDFPQEKLADVLENRTGWSQGLGPCASLKETVKGRGALC